MMSNKQVKLCLKILLVVIYTVGVVLVVQQHVENETAKPAPIDFPVQFSKE